MPMQVVREFKMRSCTFGAIIPSFAYLKNPGSRNLPVTFLS